MSLYGHVPSFLGKCSGVERLLGTAGVSVMYKLTREAPLRRVWEQACHPPKLPCGPWRGPWSAPAPAPAAPRGLGHALTGRRGAFLRSAREPRGPAPCAQQRRRASPRGGSLALHRHSHGLLFRSPADGCSLVSGSAVTSKAAKRILIRVSARARAFLSACGMAVSGGRRAISVFQRLSKQFFFSVYDIPSSRV